MRHLQIWILAMAAALAASSTAAAAVLPVCPGPDKTVRSGTCIYNGDTGWQEGFKWRLKDIDAPKISSRFAECRHEQVLGIKARDRLRVWMARGYTVLPTGRTDSDGIALVDITLADGRDLGRQMLSEDLVQAWPNTGNKWCGREE